MRTHLLIGCMLAALVACTESTPKPEASPRRPKRERARTLESPPPQQTEPEAPPSSPARVEPDPTLSQWWCLCYQRQGAAGPEPMTACRETHEQCRKLEARVGKGSKEIIAGSLINGCRTLTGHHPSDAAGTREQWQPSALAGSWVSEGACQLQGMVAAEPEPEPEPESEEEEEVDFTFYQNELIGDIARGQDTATLRHALGEPSSKTTIEEEGATGDWIQTWNYPEGLSLDMRSDTRGGPQVVRAITIEAPSKLKTRRSMGIGSSREAVVRAYGDVQAKDAEASDEDFIAGSIYGGLFFDFTDGEVSRIYLGPGAE